MGVLTGIAGGNSDLHLLDGSGSGMHEFTDDIHFLQKQPGVLIVGVASTLVLAFLWLEFLKRFTKCVVYTSLAAAVSLLVVVGILLFREGQRYGTIAGVIVMVFALILVIMIFFARKKINFSCAIIGHACRAVQGNLSIFTALTPLVLVMTVVYFVWWILTAIYVASNKGSHVDCTSFITSSSCKSHACTVSTLENGTQTCTGEGYDVDTAIWWSYLYLVFMLFWGVAFLSGVAKTSIAGTISSWYFTRNKENVPCMNSIRMLYWCFRYHFGTIALGSGLLAIVRFIEFLLEKAQSETDNVCIKLVLCLIRCIVGCFEAMLRFITKYAYVYVAMHGEGFFTSCKKVSNLFTRSSFGTLFLNDLVAHLIVRVGTVACVSLVVIGAELYMHGQGDVSVTTLIVLACFSAFTFLLVGNVVEMAADTVIVCYMEDEERNKTTGDFIGGETHMAIRNSAQGNNNINGGQQTVVYGAA
eukprot:TRINITY_DN11347_c0_g1_i1.p1 TRINITY_DN11347_c0_g1~~TRINITY_DN11347_c0_g1_i1.p1  ORF type:complete len:540 (+),score=224.92 TRINITY_DN11347_c0_g1_i1:207-1622(+)